MNTVQFKQDVVDYGDAHSFFVTGYRSISRISAGIIRETFYEEREMGDGTTERRVALHVLWDAEQWLAARRAVAVMPDPKHIPPVPQAADGPGLTH
jgi:hypothetical protein